MSFTPHQPFVAGTIISILQVRKLRVSGPFASLRSQNQEAIEPGVLPVLVYVRPK